LQLEPQLQLDPQLQDILLVLWCKNEEAQEQISTKGRLTKSSLLG
jgi:hypothetical protein